MEGNRSEFRPGDTAVDESQTFELPRTGGAAQSSIEGGLSAGVSSCQMKIA